MKWNRVRIDVLPEHADFAGYVLWQVGSRGVEFIDPCDLFWVRSPLSSDEIQAEMPSSEAKPCRVSVIGYFATERDASQIVEAVEQAFGRAGVSDACISLEPFDDEKWQEEWRRSFEPLRISDRVVVVPAWEQAEKRQGEIVVRLDPGMAFGTGSHPTTAMCARMLESCVRPGMAVLDLGTGSGILAILSALLGARTVTAVDIDIVAVEKARHNIELNGLSDRVRVVQGDLISGIDGTYDVVVANIIAHAIIRLLPEVKRIMAPCGKLIVSGIIRERKAECLDTAAANGFSISEVCEDAEWVGALLITP